MIHKIPTRVRVTHFTHSLIKPAKLYMCTQNTTLRGNAPDMVSHSGTAALLNKHKWNKRKEQKVVQDSIRSLKAADLRLVQLLVDSSVVQDFR